MKWHPSHEHKSGVDKERERPQLPTDIAATRLRRRHRRHRDVSAGRHRGFGKTSSASAERHCGVNGEPRITSVGPAKIYVALRRKPTGVTRALHDGLSSRWSEKIEFANGLGAAHAMANAPTAGPLCRHAEKT